MDFCYKERQLHLIDCSGEVFCLFKCTTKAVFFLKEIDISICMFFLCLSANANSIPEPSPLTGNGVICFLVTYDSCYCTQTQILRVPITQNRGLVSYCADRQHRYLIGSLCGFQLNAAAVMQ